MEEPQISQDDLIDILEMTQDIEQLISGVLRDNDLNVALSALMSATINCLLAQCSTLEQAVFYRNIFVKMFDSSIKSIQIKGREKPTSF